LSNLNDFSYTKTKIIKLLSVISQRYFWYRCSSFSFLGCGPVDFLLGTNTKKRRSQGIWKKDSRFDIAETRHRINTNASRSP